MARELYVHARGRAFAPINNTGDHTHGEAKNAHEPIPCPPPRNLVPRSLGYFFVCRPPVRVLRCVCPPQWGGDPHTRPTHSHGVMVSLSACLAPVFLFSLVCCIRSFLRCEKTRRRKHNSRPELPPLQIHAHNTQTPVCFFLPLSPRFAPLLRKEWPPFSLRSLSNTPMYCSRRRPFPLLFSPAYTHANLSLSLLPTPFFPLIPPRPPVPAPPLGRGLGFCRDKWVHRGKKDPFQWPKGKRGGNGERGRGVFCPPLYKWEAPFAAPSLIQSIALAAAVISPRKKTQAHIL